MLTGPGSRYRDLLLFSVFSVGRKRGWSQQQYTTTASNHLECAMVKPRSTLLGEGSKQLLAGCGTSPRGPAPFCAINLFAEGNPGIVPQGRIQWGPTGSSPCPVQGPLLQHACGKPAGRGLGGTVLRPAVSQAVICRKAAPQVVTARVSRKFGRHFPLALPPLCSANLLHKIRPGRRKKQSRNHF